MSAYGQVISIHTFRTHEFCRKKIRTKNNWGKSLQEPLNQLKSCSTTSQRKRSKEKQLKLFFYTIIKLVDWIMTTATNKVCLTLSIKRLGSPVGLASTGVACGLSLRFDILYEVHRWKKCLENFLRELNKQLSSLMQFLKQGLQE